MRRSDAGLMCIGISHNKSKRQLLWFQNYSSDSLNSRQRSSKLVRPLGGIDSRLILARNLTLRKLLSVDRAYLYRLSRHYITRTYPEEVQKVTHVLCVACCIVYNISLSFGCRVFAQSWMHLATIHCLNRLEIGGRRGSSAGSCSMILVCDPMALVVSSSMPALFGMSVQRKFKACHLQAAISMECQLMLRVPCPSQVGNANARCNIVDVSKATSICCTAASSFKRLCASYMRNKSVTE